MIGVFDSGFGGLSILKEVRKKLPQYDYLYLGDTARAPYGPRSLQSVYEFTREAVDYLMREGCELVIIACNTASADALRHLQREYLPRHYPDRRILGVIVPAVEAAVTATKNGTIGLLATEGTVASGTVVDELKKLQPKAKVFQEAAPMLVTLVEAGEHKTKAAELILKDYLKPLLAKHIDTLILACTHYGHLEPLVKKIVGKRVRVISEGKIVAQKLAQYMDRHPEIASRISHGGEATFLTTGEKGRFETLGSGFLGEKIKATQITLS